MAYLLASLIIPILAIPFVYLKRNSRKACGLICVTVGCIDLILVSLAYFSGAPLHIEEYKWIPKLLHNASELSFKLFIDGASLVASIATLVLVIATSLYSIDYIEHDIFAYYVFLLLLTLGLLGIFTSSNLIAFYMFLEFMLIPSYFIISGWGLPGARRAAFKFFIYTHVGALFSLVGIALTYFKLGTIDILTMPHAIFSTPGWRHVWSIIFALYVVGFLVKAGAFPVHSWLPDAHSIAPTPMSSLLSGIIAASGVYALFRIPYMSIIVPTYRLGINVQNTLIIMAILGILSVYYGGYLALRERDVKRIPAYSTISHNGYMITGLTLGIAAIIHSSYTSLAILGVLGAIFHLLSHALGKGLFFMVAGTVLEETCERDITKTNMLLKLMPWTGAFGFFSSFAIAGAPPFATFISELLMIIGSIYSGLKYAKVFTILLALGTALSAAYALRFWWFTFWRGKEDEKVNDVKYIARVGMILLGVLLILFGVIPFPILNQIKHGIMTFLKLLH